KATTSRQNETEESGTTAGNPNTSYRLLPFTVSGGLVENVKLCLHKIVIDGQESLIDQEFEVEQSPVLIFTGLQASINNNITLVLDNTCGTNYSVDSEGFSTTEQTSIIFNKTSAAVSESINLKPTEALGIFNNSVLSNLSGTF
ncbi:MAG: hypothetical protein ACJARO_001871, partial [Bacteriovoracaceae bacterium]